METTKTFFLKEIENVIKEKNITHINIEFYGGGDNFDEFENLEVYDKNENLVDVDDDFVQYIHRRSFDVFSKSWISFNDGYTSGDIIYNIEEGKIILNHSYEDGDEKIYDISFNPKKVVLATATKLGNLEMEFSDKLVSLCDTINKTNNINVDFYFNLSDEDYHNYPNVAFEEDVYELEEEFINMVQHKLNTDLTSININITNDLVLVEYFGEAEPDANTEEYNIFE